MRSCLGPGGRRCSTRCCWGTAAGPPRHRTTTVRAGCCCSCGYLCSRVLTLPCLHTGNHPGAGSLGAGRSSGGRSPAEQQGDYDYGNDYGDYYEQQQAPLEGGQQDPAGEDEQQPQGKGGSRKRQAGRPAVYDPPEGLTIKGKVRQRTSSFWSRAVHGTPTYPSCSCTGRGLRTHPT